MDYGSVFNRVHVGKMEAHYKPAWEYDSLMVPFLTPEECRAQLDTVCCGCLDGMNWENVAIAGGSVSACLTSRHYITTNEALEAYTTMDVDLFVFSPEALDKTVEHFKNKFPDRVFFGFNRGVIVVCIRGIPRVFQIILVDSDFTSLVTRFDLDFCQAILTQSQILITPRCAMAHATRVCVASPYVLPNRQHKALRKGFGLYVVGDDVVNLRTMWDEQHSYVPDISHTDEQIRYNMRLNLRCKEVTSSSDEIMSVLNTTDLRNGPDYIPRSTTRHTFTGVSFLKSLASIEGLVYTLPPELPLDGVVGITLSFTLVFQRYLWVYSPQADSVVLQNHRSNYVAPGRADLLEFTNKMQSVFDEMYGEGMCTYEFPIKNTLRVNVTPSSRILDVATQTIVDPDNISLEHEVCICTAMQCSSIVLGDDWWAPIFVCQEVEVFPLEMADIA
jgi:hypothetical protein